MELLQFLLSFFTQEFGDKYKGVFDLFKNNSFDLKSVLNNLNVETLAPLIKDLFSGIKNFSPQNNLQAEGLLPIKNIADENIVSALNDYLESSF